jgi:hypothetical protein
MNTTVTLTPPMFGFIVATRAALAFGMGLLVASRIPEARRRTVGLWLVAVGAATTIPAAAALRANRKEAIASRRLHAMK